MNLTDAGGHAIDWAERNRDYNRTNGIGKYAYGNNDLDRQRNGLHDSSFDWSKGSNSVKIGDTYVSGKQYDALKADIINLASAYGGFSFRSGSSTSRTTMPGILPLPPGIVAWSKEATKD